MAGSLRAASGPSGLPQDRVCVVPCSLPAVLRRDNLACAICVLSCLVWPCGASASLWVYCVCMLSHSLSCVHVDMHTVSSAPHGSLQLSFTAAACNTCGRFKACSIFSKYHTSKSGNYCCNRQGQAVWVGRQGHTAVGHVQAAEDHGGLCDMNCPCNAMTSEQKAICMMVSE